MAFHFICKEYHKLSPFELWYNCLARFRFQLQFLFLLKTVPFIFIPHWSNWINIICLWKGLFCEEVFYLYINSFRRTQNKAKQIQRKRSYSIALWTHCIRSQDGIYSASIKKNPIGNCFIEKKVDSFRIHLTWALCAVNKEVTKHSFVILSVQFKWNDMNYSLDWQKIWTFVHSNANCWIDTFCSNDKYRLYAITLAKFAPQ